MSKVKRYSISMGAGFESVDFDIKEDIAGGWVKAEDVDKQQQVIGQMVEALEDIYSDVENVFAPTPGADMALFKTREKCNEALEAYKALKEQK